jgi:hypothetical protein
VPLRLEFFDGAPIYQMSRAARSAPESDQCDVALKRETVDSTTENRLFSVQEKYPTKELV